MASDFSTPLYNLTTKGKEKVVVDVTNSISAGLDGNAGLMTAIVPWMKQVNGTRVLDFGAGALRHTIPLLREGFEVVSVDFPKAYERPKAAEFLAKARRFSGFTEMVWPNDFLRCSHEFDVAILTFVLQVIPVKSDRRLALESIAKRFDRNGPKRLYYASRTNETAGLKDEMRYNDGWVKGRGENDRTFYTEWTRQDTDQFFKQAGYSRAGSYSGAQQAYIYQYGSGVL